MDHFQHFEELRVCQVFIIIVSVESLEELLNGVVLLVDVRGNVDHRLLFYPLFHGRSVINPENDLCDLLLLD